MVISNLLNTTSTSGRRGAGGGGGVAGPIISSRERRKGSRQRHHESFKTPALTSSLAGVRINKPVGSMKAPPLPRASSPRFVPVSRRAILGHWRFIPREVNTECVLSPRRVNGTDRGRSRTVTITRRTDRAGAGGGGREARISRDGVSDGAIGRARGDSSVPEALERQVGDLVLSEA